MWKFGTGEAWSVAKTEARMDLWISRWNTHDPFSSFAVSKNDDDTFLGHVVLGHGDQRGQSELAYVFNKPSWGKRYGSEAVSSIVNEYAPELVQRGYQLEGEDFQSITATVRDDNEASFKILKNAGMQRVREEIKFAHLRHVFFKSVNDKPLIVDQIDNTISY